MKRTEEEIRATVKKRVESRKLLISYEEATERYNLGVTTLRKMAKDCKALYKIGRSARINIEIMDKYMETFRL